MILDRSTCCSCLASLLLLLGTIGGLGPMAGGQEAAWSFQQLVLPAQLTPPARAAAQRALGWRAGDGLTPEGLDAALRQVVATGHFQPDLELRVERAGERGSQPLPVRVRLVARELPRVEAVDVWGAPAGPRSETEARLKGFEGRGLYAERLEYEAHQLLRFYGEHGHPFAEVDFRVESGFEGPGTRRLAFWVHPGPEVQLGDAALEGDPAGLEKGLRRAIDFKEGRRYHPAKVEQALQATVGLARRQGHLDARVALLGLEWDPPKRTVQLSILFIAGRQYRVGRLRVDGFLGGVPEGELLAATGLSVGAPLIYAEVHQGADAARQLMSDRTGQPVVVVSSLSFPSLEEAVVDVTFRFQLQGE